MEFPIVDCRSRPMALHPFYAEPEVQADLLRWNARVGSDDPAHFRRSASIGEYLAEAGENGIAVSVVIGRQVENRGFIPNDRVAEVVAHSESLVGVAVVDPTNPSTGGVSGAVAEARRAIGELGLVAVDVDPGMGAVPVLPDDRRLYPVYAALEELGVPVWATASGPGGPHLDHALPRHYGVVAREFPNLDIVLGHGGFPFFHEAIGVAYQYENVHLSPDMYGFMPPFDAIFIEALKGFLQDQFLFGSGYPYFAMRSAVERIMSWPLPESVLEKVLSTNARRLLGLGPD